MNTPTLEIVIIMFLLIFNGIFSAGEIAIVSCRKSKIKEMRREKKDKRVEMLFEMKENPERFLSAAQIGITLFGTLASAIGGVVAVNYIKPLLQKIPYVSTFDEIIALILVVSALTYLFLVFGELVPKYVGMNYKEKVALRIVPIFHFTARVFFFFVNLLTFSTMFVVKSFGLKKGEEHIGEGEIKILLEEGRRKGVFNETEERLIHGVFAFADKSVKEIMVPKPSIYAINIEESKDKVLEYIIENQFSRYPVYREHLENIIGVVYHKDITSEMWSRGGFELEKLIKKPYFVPDTMEISLLLREMQKQRQHLAVVADEYGTTVGIVTLEDIMEEVFGEIMDETDVDDRIERSRDGSIVIDAAYSVRDLNNRLDLDLPESPDYETLSGFILGQLQEIPKGGEIIYYGPHRFTVVGVKERRITKVKLEKTRRSIKR